MGYGDQLKKMSGEEYDIMSYTNYKPRVSVVMFKGL